MDFISIEGYKSIKNERIELQPINILIGANGSGKSNFISFFDFLNRLYDRKLNEYIALKGGANKILHKGQKETTAISFNVSFDKQKNTYSATLVLGNDGFVFTKENLGYKDNDCNISFFGREAN